MKIAFNVTWITDKGQILFVADYRNHSSYFEWLGCAERAIISAALEQGKGLSHAAQSLGINKDSLRSKVNKYGLDYRPGKGGKKGKRK